MRVDECQVRQVLLWIKRGRNFEKSGADLPVQKSLGTINFFFSDATVSATHRKSLEYVMYGVGTMGGVAGGLAASHT